MRTPRITAQGWKYSHHLARIFFAALLTAPVLYAEAVSEYRVKAAYLFNFAKLAEWPSGALPAGTSPLSICVFGDDDDFVDVLRSTTGGKNIAGHAISIKATRSLKELSSCQLVFVRSGETKHTSAVVASLTGNSTLLIGEDDRFLTDGGMINLSLAEGRVRFQTNSDALNRGHIGFDSSFLSLATGEGDRNRPAQSAGTRALLSSPPPQIPDMARRMNLSGAVQLQAVVRPDGTVKEVRVLGGHPLLVEASVEAVRQWRYRPGLSETVEVVRISLSP